MEIQVHRLDAARVPHFYLLHCEENGLGWCCCAAWWVPEWDAFARHTVEENRCVREDLFARGEHDGYLLYVDGEPAAWCQASPRDRLAKLVKQYALEPAPGTWAVTCFAVAPRWRRKGLAARLLASVLADLCERGATRVEAFPKRPERGAPPLAPDDAWTGPEPLFLAAGFTVAREHERWPVLTRAVG